MKVTVLVENTTNSELKSEHGLSLFIEYGKKKYLLDAGNTGIFYDNAKEMEIDLDEISCAVLSHGHYDHAGGFYRFFKECKKKKLYMMDSAVNEYLSGTKETIHEIGIPKIIIENYAENFCYITKTTEIDDNIYVVPHSTKGLEKIGEKAKLYKMEKEMVPDDFCHEMSLVFKTGKGLVIFNSCSHAGVKNIIEEVKEALREEQIYAYIGGLHMKGMKDGEVICTFSREEVKEMTDCIKQAGIKKVYTGHCTGEAAMEIISEFLKDTVCRMYTGMVIEL